MIFGSVILYTYTFILNLSRGPGFRTSPMVRIFQIHDIFKIIFVSDWHKNYGKVSTLIMSLSFWRYRKNDRDLQLLLSKLFPFYKIYRKPSFLFCNMIYIVIYCWASYLPLPDLWPKQNNFSAWKIILTTMFLTKNY